MREYAEAHATLAPPSGWQAQTKCVRFREFCTFRVRCFLPDTIFCPRISLTPFRTEVVLCSLKSPVLFYFTQNTRKTRKPCGMEMLLHGGIRRGARYTCATSRMGSTNKVCALPRILCIPRETFLLGSNFLTSSLFLAIK